MKSVPVMSSNFLECIADPASRFHAVYLSYRNGKVTKNEVVARLPHVAMLGDSVCMGIYISWPWSTFWRAHTSHGGNWFLDNGPVGPGIHSVSRRLEEITPFVAIEYAGIGAMVDQERDVQISSLFPSSLSAQFDSSCFNRERRTARNRRRAESRACGH